LSEELSLTSITSFTLMDWLLSELNKFSKFFSSFLAGIMIEIEKVVSLSSK